MERINLYFKGGIEMSTIKQQLEVQWKEEKKKLDSMKIEDEKQIEVYKIQVERVKHLEKELADLEKSEKDVEEKAACREDESKDRKTRNIIEVAKVVVPVVSAFAMGLISMKWEKTDTLTSTAGKSSLREILRFK